MRHTTIPQTIMSRTDSNRSRFMNDAANSFALSRHFAFVMICFVSSCLLSGCASLTNPTANGVPVRILPEDILAESKEGFEPLPLTLLRQQPAEQYLLESGDTLGIYIEGILGNEEIPPPVNVPDSLNQPPSIGYPFPIRKDGTVSLPYVGKVGVAKPALEESITIEEAEKRVIEAYREKDILRVGDERILVSLMRPRYIRVLVLRADPNRSNVSYQNNSLLGLGSRTTTIGGGRSSVGQILELPANENDVLNALARTGGIPGVDTTQEIIIQRGFWNTEFDPAANNYAAPTAADIDNLVDSDKHITRISLMRHCDDPIPFGPKDVVLNDGDIIVIRSRDPEYFYTGGLLPSRENLMPFDYDLTVVEAIMRSNGPVLNGGINANNFNGALLGSGVGNPSPSLVSVIRKLPMGGQITIRVDLNEAMRDPRQNLLVQAEDVLILQEAPNEAITRYMTQVLQFNFFGRFINHSDLQGTANAVLP